METVLISEWQEISTEIKHIHIWLLALEILYKDQVLVPKKSQVDDIKLLWAVKSSTSTSLYLH